MKSFDNFKEDMEQSLKGMTKTLIPQLQSIAKQNKKSPKELTKLRDGITSKVAGTLGKKLDVKGLINKIPDSEKMSGMVGKMQGKMEKKFSSPSFQKKFDKLNNMLDGLTK